MNYEPYDPGTPDRTPADGPPKPDAEEARPTYQAPPPVPVGRQPYRAPAPQPKADNSPIMAIIGVGVTVVFSMILMATMGNQADDEPYVPPSYSCAMEHDEENSLFSDEEWCDLELNGGDGDGAFDDE